MWKSCKNSIFAKSWICASLRPFKINCNQNIRGITINNSVINNIHHADDLSLAFKVKISIEGAIDIPYEFCKKNRVHFIRNSKESL